MAGYQRIDVPPVVDKANVVLGHIPCALCRYDLIGIPNSGNCPECGNPVQFTLRGQLLRDAPRQHIRQIDLGARILLGAIAAQVAVYAISILSLFLALRSTIGFVVPALATRTLSLLCSAAFVVGYWKYTQPDPGYVGERIASARAVTRTAACVGGAVSLLGLVFSLVASASASRNFAASSSLTTVGALALAVEFFASVRYTRWLAKRVPDPSLIARCDRNIYLIPALYIGGFAAVLLTFGLALAGAAMGPVFVVVLFFALLLAGLVLYAHMVWSLRLHTTRILRSPPEQERFPR
jgi:hypothetical protein